MTIKGRDFNDEGYRSPKLVQDDFKYIAKYIEDALKDKYPNISSITIHSVSVYTGHSKISIHMKNDEFGEISKLEDFFFKDGEIEQILREVKIDSLLK
jgi:hypothetical protein